MDEKGTIWYNIKKTEVGEIFVEIRKIPTSGHASNCWILFDETSREAAVIDPSADAEEIMRVLAEDSLTLTQIWLTHGHFDHIFAADTLRDKTGAPLMIHRKDAHMLTDAYANASALFFGEGETYREADGQLKGGDALRLGEHTVFVRHTPGHTAGSVTLVADTFLFTGDTLFENSIGRSDLPSGDAQALSDSLRRLVKMPGDYTVCSGHGEITTLEKERKNNPFLKNLFSDSKETTE